VRKHAPAPLRIPKLIPFSRYLCETYDKEGKLLPADPAQRVKALRWLHAAEATFALHAIGILYVRWNGEKYPEAIATIEEGMSKNVQKDLAWLEQELSSSGGQFLLGSQITIADIMMQFSIAFIFARELGTKGKKFPAIEKWMSACENTESYKKAVKKTGHKL
jgi:glutathione S-transferase